MSTQPVSSLSIYQELQSFYQNRQTDLQGLGTALQSGNLATAQQAYSQLVSLGQTGPFGNAEPFGRSDRAQDFEAVGQALSSGDLAGAQAAFAQLQQSLAQTGVTSQPVSPAYLVNLTSTSGAAQISAGSQSSGGPQNTSGTTGTSSTSGTSGTTGSAGTASTEPIYEQIQNFYTERNADLQQLGQALTAGDLTTAQQAYTNLVQLGQEGPFANGNLFENSGREQDFQALGQALQSGTLANAQQAFATLESTFGGNYHGGPVPPVTQTPTSTSPNSTTSLSEIVINIGGSGSGSSTSQGTNGSELVLNLPSPSSGSPEEVQINLGGSGSSTNQLTIDVGQTQGQNGTSGEQITINFGQATNENIILNLFGANSTSQSTQTQSSSLNVQG